MHRNRTLVGIVAALIALALTPARADDYPSKPIRFIVPAALASSAPRRSPSRRRTVTRC